MKRLKRYFALGIIGGLCACVPPMSEQLPHPALVDASAACVTEAPESNPCATPFDISPEVIQAAPDPDGTKEIRVSTLWLYVDEDGHVVNTQLRRSAGRFGFDLHAVKLAKQMRFRPARLNGRPVGVWISLPIKTDGGLEICSTMAVPISAGVAVFVDSARLDRPTMGMSYRYESPYFIASDVFIYSRATSPDPSQQADQFLEVMELYREQGRFDAVRVLRRAERTVEDRRFNRAARFTGYEVRIRLTQDGRELESYFAVFSRGDDYLKFRVTYLPVAESRNAAEEFVKQVLSAIARQPAGCPT